MLTYAICYSDGTINSVYRSDVLPGEFEMKMSIPEGGFLIDLTGQEPFDTLDILDIHNGFVADPQKKMLIKLE